MENGEYPGKYARTVHAYVSYCVAGEDIQAGSGQVMLTHQR